MIPGNEPTGDGRYAGITTVTAQQWQSLARLIGRPDMADDDQLGTMIGRFIRADEVNAALHAWTSAHTADEVVAACVDARASRPRSSATAPSSRVSTTSWRGDVFVTQPGERWIRPRAPFRFHAVRRSASCTPPSEASGDMAGRARHAPGHRTTRPASGRSRV